MCSLQGHAIVFPESNKVELRSFELRKPGPGEVLIETAFSCISPGTELRRLHGKERLGSHAFPLVPGYCLAGRIKECGTGVNLEEGCPIITCGTLEAGNLNLGEGGHVSNALASAEMILPVPENVELLDASAVILAGIAYHGLLQSRPMAGEKVAVIGLGVIGQLAARLHAACGADVVGADLSRYRVDLLNAAGIKAFVPSGSLKDGFACYFNEGADIIVDATGQSAVLPQAIQVGRQTPWNPRYDTPGIRYLIQGSYEDSFAIPYADAYMSQATILIPRGSQVNDWKTALDLLSRKRFKISNLISDVRSPEQAEKTYVELQKPGTTLMTAAFRWQ